MTNGSRKGPKRVTWFMDSPLFLYLPDSRTVTIVVWVWEVEDCIGRCEALGADPLDLNIPDILQPDGATQLVIEQPKLGVLVTDQNSKELKHFHHLTSWTSGAKASPSVPMMSWQIPFIPLASELGVGPMSSHQPSGSLQRFSQFTEWFISSTHKDSRILHCSLLGLISFKSL